MLLELNHISKRFGGVQALNDVSLAIDRADIFCLAGENGSGKSTLIKTIAGVVTPDSGNITIAGNTYTKLRPGDALREGIQIIYQDFSLFPNLSAAENISLNTDLASGRRLVNWRDVRRTAESALAKIDVDIDLSALVETLPVVDKQLIAIARALLQDAKLIVMDEPTSALTGRETRTLLNVIEQLKKDGLAVLFVSHKLNEVLEISEKIAILRNGEKVSSGDADDFDWDKLAYHMTGRSFTADDTSVRRSSKEGAEILNVEHLSKSGQFDDISFGLRTGEILGITGLLGSGRTALAKALFGMTTIDNGQIVIDGKSVTLEGVQDAIRHGVGYVPEDRLTEGVFPGQSIGQNIVASEIDALSTRFGMTKPAAIRQQMYDWVKDLQITTPSPHYPVHTLSGGNQQRVVLARWLALEPRILILNGPTVGVDIGSKEDIHELITQLATQGLGVLVISDDIPELFRTCERILLMKRGSIVQRFERDKVTQDELAQHLVSYE